MASVNLPLSELPSYLEARARAVADADFTKPLKTIRLLLISATKQNFAQGVDPDGDPWVPLKNPSKRRGGSSALPLRDTGVLMASVTASGVGSIDEMTSRGITFGTAISYGIYHQEGTRHIPQRKFLGLNDDLLAKINKVLQRFIAALMKDAAQQEDDGS